MDKDRETLKFRTMWLRNTVHVLKTTCKNYSDDTRARIAELVANKATK